MQKVRSIAYRMRRVSILGATGSIGKQALDVLSLFPERFILEGISLHRQIEAIPNLLARYRPKWIAITDSQAYQRLLQEDGLWREVEVLSIEGLYEKLAVDPGEVVLNAIVGAVGFWASWHTLRGPALLALANKESLVFGGAWLSSYRSRIIPVDSEHSALFQCLTGEEPNAVARLILTASGGPFRGRKASDLAQVSPQEALSHPVWRMGNRITIDSATLMNKALELIEAHWLFGISHHQIEAWVHPQCIVHSLVEFIDGSLKAQLSLPDMRLPILYALAYPERLSWEDAPYRIPRLSQLHFEAIDEETFPSLQLARKALDKSIAAPALLNAADEVAVEYFLQGRMRFLEIFDILDWALTQPEAGENPTSPQELTLLEKDFRKKVQSYLYSCKAKASS